MSKVVVMDHPLIEQKIGIIRRKETGTKDFRQNISEIAMLIDRKSTRLNSSHLEQSRMPSSA